MQCGRPTGVHQLFHDGGSYDIENSSLICSANQRTGFYKIETSVMKKLNLLSSSIPCWIINHTEIKIKCFYAYTCKHLIVGVA